MTPLDLDDSTKERRSPVATEQHEHNKSRRFGSKNLKLLPESQKLNGNIFFELFLGDLDEKMASKDYKKQETRNRPRQCEKPIIYSICSPRGAHHVRMQKAFFWIISALEASKWSRITFCILTNVLTSISERFGPRFWQINISPTATVLAAVCIQITWLDKTLPRIWRKELKNGL